MLTYLLGSESVGQRELGTLFDHVGGAAYFATHCVGIVGTLNMQTSGRERKKLHYYLYW